MNFSKIKIVLTEEGAAQYNAWGEEQYKNGPPNWTPVEEGFEVVLNPTGWSRYGVDLLSK